MNKAYHGMGLFAFAAGLCLFSTYLWLSSLITRSCSILLVLRFSVMRRVLRFDTILIQNFEDRLHNRRTFPPAMNDHTVCWLQSILKLSSIGQEEPGNSCHIIYPKMLEHDYLRKPAMMSKWIVESMNDFFPNGGKLLYIYFLHFLAKQVLLARNEQSSSE